MRSAIVLECKLFFNHSLKMNKNLPTVYYFNIILYKCGTLIWVRVCIMYSSGFWRLQSDSLYFVHKRSIIDIAKINSSFSLDLEIIKLSDKLHFTETKHIWKFPNFQRSISWNIQGKKKISCSFYNIYFVKRNNDIMFCGAVKCNFSRTDYLRLEISITISIWRYNRTNRKNKV